MGLFNLLPCDIFNQYVFGRSAKVDITATQPSALDLCDDNASTSGSKVRCLYEWAYAMISNRHCRIYCRLDDEHCLPGDIPTPQVFIEDSSGNGTLINRTTLLRKGEKRILHSGDEICLANPETLRRKIPSERVRQQILQQHSFVFVSLINHRHPQGHLSSTVRQLSTEDMPPPQRATAAVDARAAKHHQSPQDVQQSQPKQFGAIAGFGHGKKPISFGALVMNRLESKKEKKEEPRRFEEDYDLRDKLGSGTAGQVYRAIHRKTGQERAVKIIPWSSGGGANRSFQRKGAAANKTHPWKAEAEILQTLEHPYIVNLIDNYVSPSGLYLVMELLPGGDLFDRIVDRVQFTENQSRRVLRRLLSAVHYLHEDCNIVHRDLKPENILMLSRSSDIDIQITDFGLAKTDNGDGLKTFCGTPAYFAPEVLQRQLTVTGEGRYGKPADMWSVGVILYVLLSGTPPFDNALPSAPDINSSPHQISFPDEYWSGVSEGARDLIRNLLVPNPLERYTVAQACEHHWVNLDDGDTHIHPLDDPKLSQRKETHHVTLNLADSAKNIAEKASSKAMPMSNAKISVAEVDNEQPPDDRKIGPSWLLPKDGPSTPVTDRPPLSPTTVNSRPQAFRQQILDQAASEKGGKKQHASNDSERIPIASGDPLGSEKIDGEEDDIRSEFSERTESISSFGANSRDSESSHLEARSLEPVPKPKNPKKRKSTGSGKSDGKKQMTLSNWCTKE